MLKWESISDSNEIGNHNHLVRKRTLNRLAKLAGLANAWVFVYELSGCGSNLVALS